MRCGRVLAEGLERLKIILQVLATFFDGAETLCLESFLLAKPAAPSKEVGDKGRRAGFEVGGVRGSHGSLAAAGSATQERTRVVAKARRARC